MPNHLFDAICNAIPSPEAAFIETESGSILTYGEMLELSARLANALVSAGVVAGDRVAVQVEKSAEALMLYLACLRAGAIYLPLNTAYTAAELEYFIGDSKPSLLVISPEKTSSLAEIAQSVGAKLETLDASGGGSLMEHASQQSVHFDNIDRLPDDLAAILYTSGTTGRSKGAMLSHDNLLSNALTLKEQWHYSSDDRLIHALPIFHTHGLFVATNVSLLSGASMFLLGKFDVEAIFSLMPRATILMGVPTFYTRLLQDLRLTREALSHMRLFISGSAPLLAETHRTFTAQTGHAILERYGMTEANMITSNPYGGDRVAGTVGYALPGISVRVVDAETGRTMAHGAPGMLEIKGPNVFKGYWNMPEKTKEEFRADGYFITGDICTMEPEGRIAIVGRGKDLIISGGFNIYPKEIENEIDALDGVIESAVIGVPHPDFGETPVAIVIKQSGSSIEAGAVQAALTARLARFKQPKHVEFVDALPRNTMGKVQKNVLRDQFKNLFNQ